MYPVQNRMTTYDQAKVELRIEGFKLVLDGQQGRTTRTRVARTISHNGQLVGVVDETFTSDDDGPALVVQTDGEQAFRLFVSVTQGSESEDRLAEATNAPSDEPVRFFLCDRNDEKGIGNSWLFHGVVRLPTHIAFGQNIATRVFVIDVVDVEDEGEEDEVDDWTPRAFRFDGSVHGRPVVTELPFTLN